MTIAKMVLNCQTRLRVVTRMRIGDRRHTSTTAASAAHQLMTSFEGKTQIRKQLLDGNQLQKLSLTLNRRNFYPGLDVTESAPPNGTPLPPGYHLVYFTPNGVESQLGRDGTDVTYNAAVPFTRRMWAGGRLRWIEGRQLRVGELVEERTHVLSAEPKRSKDGKEMVVVNVEKEFWGEDGLALVDQRSWLYRPEVVGNISESKEVTSKPLDCPSSVEDVTDGATGHLERHFKWSPAGLFRFSALTFNGHRIHYDSAWSQSIEGHPGIVVHGPLNLINMLDFWRDTREGKGLPELDEISYRATSPVYAGDEYAIRSSSGVTSEKETEVRVERKGVSCMKGQIRDRSSQSQ